MQALGGKSRALQNAKSMLLVDNRQRERAEFDVLLHERMGADDEMNVAALNGRQQRPPFGCA